MTFTGTIAKKLYTIVIFVGLMFYWPFLRNSITGVLLSSQFTSIFTLLDISIIIIIIITILLYIMYNNIFNRVINKPIFIGIVTLGITLFSVITQLFINNIIINLFLAMFFSIAYAIYSLLWLDICRYLYNINSTFIIYSILGSYSCSLLLGLPSYVIDNYALYRAIITPCITGICLIFAIKLTNYIYSNNSIISHSPNTSHHSLILYIIIVTMFIISCVIVAFIKEGSIVYEPSYTTLIRDIINIIFGIGLLLYNCFEKRVEQMVLISGTSLFILMIVGIIVSSIAQVTYFEISLGIISSSESCLSIILFIILCQIHNYKQISYRNIYLLFILPNIMNIIISSVIIPNIVSQVEMSYATFWGNTSIFITIIFCIIIMLIFMVIIVNILFKNKSISSNITFINSVIDIKNIYKLTQREAEILQLLAYGNTYHKIAEILHIKEGTVQAHIKTLYKKLKIHSKQEAIDMINTKDI